MRPKDKPLAVQLKLGLLSYSNDVTHLPGIISEEAMTSLIEQLVESDRRIRYIQTIRDNVIRAPLKTVRNPSNLGFDPIRAAILTQIEGDLDESFWLTFLSVHFGKHRKFGWQLARDFYRGLTGERFWTWSTVTNRLGDVANWLQDNSDRLKVGGKVRFGNHRKYESLGNGSRGTANVIASYVKWVASSGGHSELFRSQAGTPRRDFDRIYQSMVAVVSFGRTARFDYLTMVGKLHLSEIEPGSPYLQGSTGPLKGAQLLFGQNATTTTSTLDEQVVTLGNHLGLGMQTMEDALCNWQKCPSKFTPFRG